METWMKVGIALTTVFNGLFFYSQWLDAKWTDKGIKAGVGVEGNEFIVKLFSNKPTFKQLEIYNLGRWAIFTTAFAVLAHFNSALGFAGLTAWGIGLAVGHYNGYKAWYNRLK